MKLRALPFASAAFAACSATGAMASIPVAVSVTCPTDGTVMEFFETAAYSTWGQRPDGKPYGTWEFPEPLPECPDGLVMYRPTFKAGDADRLRALIASPEYQALRRSGDTTYYRAYWLLSRMDAPVLDQVLTLGQAVWQADRDYALRRRYLEELVARSRDAGPPRELTGLAVRAWTANALRELGRFQESAATLRATSFAIDGDRETAREVRAWRRHYRRLAGLVAYRDSAMEPPRWIPRRELQERRNDQEDRRDSSHKQPWGACAVTPSQAFGE